MQPTISILFALAVSLLSLVSAFSQTQGPSSLRGAVNATDGAEIDALYAPRPPMIRMWNWVALSMGSMQISR